MSGKPYPQQPELHTDAPHRAAMLTYPGNFKQALREAHEDPSKILFGVGQGMPSTFVTKVLAYPRPDFIWLDVEHAMFNRLTLHDSIHAAQAHSEGKSMVVVRIPSHSEVDLTTALDAGAAAIVIPHVETAADVKRIVKESFYPPMGARSFSPWTFVPGIYDRSLYPQDGYNIQTSNNHIAIIAQIESVKGAENADEIASMPEVDAVMFGPGDYSLDAGINLSAGSGPPQALLDGMNKVFSAAKQAGKPMFGPAQHPSMIPDMIKNGYRGIAVVFDIWALANVVNTNVREGREIARKTAEEMKKEDEKEAAATNDGTTTTKAGLNGAAAVNVTPVE